MCIRDSIGAITNGPNPDPVRSYFLNRHIDFYEAKAVSIRERSHDLAWQPGSKAEPAILDKKLFEPLGVFKNPILVPKNTRKVIWIDVWIPKSMQKGKVHGELTVTSDKTTSLQIELEVGSHPLPDDSATKTMLWSSVFEHENNYVLGRYFKSPTGEQIKQLRLEHHRLAKRHRVTLVNGVYKGNVSEALPTLSGTAYTKANGYSGPGEGLGDDLLSLHTYGGDLLPDEKRKWQGLLSKLKRKPEVIHYTYDEPSLKNNKSIKTINDRLKQSPPFKSFVTHSYDKRIPVDVFASLASHFRIQKPRKNPQYASWIYNGVRPHTGSFAIDDVAVSPRVNPWIQFMHHIERWFYWEATYYDDFQGKRGQIDVWKHAGNFSNKHDDLMNGDGLLFYPGTDLIYPASNQGVLRPLPSIRLKNWRRGIEDVEYLVMAQKKGLNLEPLLNTMVPKALNQLKSTQSATWPQDGKSWRRIRKELFDYLENGITPTTISHPSSAPAHHPKINHSNWFWALPGIGALLIYLILKTFRSNT